LDDGNIYNFLQQSLGVRKDLKEFFLCALGTFVVVLFKGNMFLSTYNGTNLINFRQLF